MRTSIALATLIALCGLRPPGAEAQWDVTPKAALPTWRLWWAAFPEEEVSFIPLLWTNDVDGAGEGCCVVGAAARRRAGPATLWLGVGFGTAPDAGAPAAFEAAAEVSGAALSFRRLHGREGFAAFLPLLRADEDEESTRFRSARLSVGATGTWIDDDRYLEKVPTFSCPAGAPAAPCERVETPFPWSEGRDYAVALEGVLGGAEGDGARLAASVLAGFELLDGDHDYFRVEAEGERRGNLRRADWRVRLAAGWASGGAPLQRRFQLDGDDPVTRWLNPYLEAQGALLSDVPYFTPGGGGLRAYSATRPLVKRYVAAGGDIGRLLAIGGAFQGRISAFLEGAWTPALPGRAGPDDFGPTSAILFDWRELSAGEGEPRGEFMARVLPVPELWADAGLALRAAFRDLSVTVAFPFWASEAAFADEPIGGGARSPVAVRWSVSAGFRHALGGVE